jgi:hypothetical protein
MVVLAPSRRIVCDDAQHMGELRQLNSLSQ